MNKSHVVNQANQLFNELNAIICQWDPYGLSNRGEIRDEFSMEVWDILLSLPTIGTKQEVQRKISEVFSNWFSPSEFPLERCEQVGNIVFDWWQSK